jgi:exodeoxyribonuclease V alpha subunit
VDKVTGVVKSIIYTNEKNGYTVCEVKTGKQVLTLVGLMPMLIPGETISALGEWTSHTEYGRQFSVKDCQRQPPSEEDEIEKYLSSGFIKGLGPSTAKKIVGRFGADTFQILAREPMRISEIKGITLEKALSFGQAFSEHESMRGIFMLAQRFGISSAYATKIWKKFGLAAEKEIMSNPYRLIEPDIGLGFKACDRIAQGMGIEAGSQFRLKSALHYVLNQSVQNGHTYYPIAALISETSQLTHVDQALVENAFDAMLLESAIHIEKQYPQRVYPDYLFEAERYCARRLSALNCEMACPIRGMDQWLVSYEERNNICLDEQQKAAIHCVLKHGLTVITGGPGTGKTTIIKTLLQIFEEHEAAIMLCAPTGRAAKRVSETSGYEAKTIHRLLEVGYTTGGDERPYFARNEENPLEADVIIVDEASMIDITIMGALLKAILPGTRLILVGDVDQLPSVGPGKVLSDIIDSREVPVVKLDKIFRQSEESMIVLNAHHINHGRQPVLNQEESDFYFISKLDARELVGTLTELCASVIPQRFGFDPLKEIQVLTPMRKGDAGVYHLNAMLQQRLNPPEENKPQKQTGSVCYRLGDRVMQIRNDYSKPWVLHDHRGGWTEGLGVYNGDMGVIMDIDLKAEVITVQFDDMRTCEYAFDSLDDLEHAYAVTVHKSQGSEFPAVIIALFSVPPALVCRNLLYTAVTRAKKLVVLVGSKSILQQMVDNLNERERYSGLKERLCLEKGLP